MQKRTILRILGMEIEWHWWFIMRYRKLGEELIAKGESLSSEKLIRISKKLNRHAVKAMEATQMYEDICGLSKQLRLIQEARAACTSQL